MIRYFVIMERELNISKNEYITIFSFALDFELSNNIILQIRTHCCSEQLVHNCICKETTGFHYFYSNNSTKKCKNIDNHLKSRLVNREIKPIKMMCIYR